MPADMTEKPDMLIVRDCSHEIGSTPPNQVVFLTLRAEGIKREDFFLVHVQHSSIWPRRKNLDIRELISSYRASG
jgi:hypothetical protein